MATIKLDIAPHRPTASAFQNRLAAAEFTETHFPPTVSSQPRVRFLNLEGAFPEIGALEEMILPIAKGIRAGTYGNLALGVITSDAHVIDVITALAEKHQVPIFISYAVDHAFVDPHPVGSLTPADGDTFQFLCNIGGASTSADMARSKGIDPAAATNRLTSIVKKGYIFRIPRSRHEGDLFVAPCLRLDTLREGVPSDMPVAGQDTEVQLPKEVRESVFQLAHEQGKTPERVLAEAWKAYYLNNREAMRQEFKKVRKLIDSGDTTALANYTTPDLDARSKEAKRRSRSDKGDR